MNPTQLLAPACLLVLAPSQSLPQSFTSPPHRCATLGLGSLEPGRISHIFEEPDLLDLIEKLAGVAHDVLENLLAYGIVWCRLILALVCSEAKSMPEVDPASSTPSDCKRLPRATDSLKKHARKSRTIFGWDNILGSATD